MKNNPKTNNIAATLLRVKLLFKSWLLPMILLILGSYLAYLMLSIFSTGFTFKATFFTDSNNIYNSISNFIELNVAILGIVLTVVAIVVQLAAQKYTPKLADLFLENKINRLSVRTDFPGSSRKPNYPTSSPCRPEIIRH